MSLNNENTENEQQPEVRSGGSVVFLTLITLLILGVAGAIAYSFIADPLVSKKKDHTDKPVIYVDTQTFQAHDQPVIIEAMGRVIPAQETALKAQVSGKVIDVSSAFIPGGYFAAGEAILNIDPTDYELNIKLKQAALRQAQASLKLEQGQQAVARDELKILERSTGKKLANNDLALRKPQLEQARANIASVQAELEMAELSLSRTTLSAPFNAIITSRNTNLGNVVSSNDGLATLVGTDEYWIEAELPSHDLAWLNFPKNAEEQGSPATIFQANGHDERTGYLKNSTGSIDTNSRLATIIIRVPDPLLHNAMTDNNKKFRLNLNDYVRIQIKAQTLKQSYKVPQHAMREGNTLWVYNEGKLHIIKPEVAHEDRFFVYITGGLNGKNQIITSDIITPIQGMDISLREAGKPE